MLPQLACTNLKLGSRVNLHCHCSYSAQLSYSNNDLPKLNEPVLEVVVRGYDARCPKFTPNFYGSSGRS